MLNYSFEYRKGILFIRLSGYLDKDNYLKNKEKLNYLINDNGIKYVVFNLNNLNRIDIYGINFILNYYNVITQNKGKVYLCEEDYNICNKIFKNKIPKIKNELEAFQYIEV